MSSTPVFIGTPKCAVAQISTANTARDGTGTIGSVYTAGASGSRIDRVVLTATGTTTAGMIRLFIYDGTNNRLIREIPVTAVTPGASTPAWSCSIDASIDALFPCFIVNTYILKASTHNAETFNVAAFGGDF